MMKKGHKEAIRTWSFILLQTPNNMKNLLLINLPFKPCPIQSPYLLKTSAIGRYTLVSWYSVW